MESARTFTVRLAELLAREHAALGEFLVALAEFDRGRLWAELGYPSLFDFLHRELSLSKASASFRKKAAELIQRFPEVLEPIRDGRLCLSSVFELAKVLTPENRDEVLPRFFQLSKREAKAVAAALRPDDVPALRDMVTAVRVTAPTAVSVAPLAPARAGTSSDASSLKVVCPDKLPDASVAAAPTHPAAVSPTPEPELEPLTADLNRIHVTVSRRFLEKLEAARDALSHSHPGAGSAEILEAGLDLLLDRRAQRNGLAKKPRGTPLPSTDTDHIPAHVRRAVWERDGGRCQWRLASGETCGSTYRLEIDHITPRAAGGPSTVENCRILCKPHNDRAARQYFGDAWMDRYTGKTRARPTTGR